VSIVIRPAASHDAALLATLHRQCFDAPWDASWDEGAFSRLLQRVGCFALLAGESETDLQAFILMQVAGGEAEIQSLGTQGVARRKGFARALLLSAAAESFRCGASEIFLEAAEDNRAALGLYESAGFSAIDRRKQYYPRSGRPPADAMILRAALPLAVPAGP
jgi:ribosomal-protein-alanine N-acetyltransferase